MRVLSFLAGSWLAACAPSAEDIEREFAEFVSEANHCAAASECGAAAADCPLGCNVAVRLDRVVAVEQKARELVADYQSGGARCIYTCVEPGELECHAGRCAFAGE